MGINQSVFNGSVLRKPQVGTTEKGVAVLNMTVVVHDRHRNPETNTWESVPSFVDCTMFGPKARYFARILDKGMNVVVQGKLRQTDWEKDGRHRSKLEVIVEEIVLVPDEKTSDSLAATEETKGKGLKEL